MKTISVTDLKLIDELKHLNYMDMVHPANDALVNGCLEQLGFDVLKPLSYGAYQHRNLQGKTVVNFLISGELSLQRKHLTGPFSSLEDRKIAASLTDQSLFIELSSMGHTSPSYGSAGALDQQVPEREDAEYKAEESAITAQIKQLEELLFFIRGSQYKSDGSLKTAWDYQHPEVRVEKKKRKKKLKLVVVEGNVND